MNAENWLMVDEWRYVNGDRQNTSRFDMVKRVNAQGSKARKLAKQYELELNGGVDDVIKHFVETKNNVYTVCPIPWNNVRDYRKDILDVIEDAPIYMPSITA